MSQSNHQKDVTSFFRSRKRKKLNQDKSRFEVCPICWISFPLHTIQNHVEKCIHNHDTNNTKNNRHQNTITKKEEGNKKNPSTDYYISTNDDDDDRKKEIGGPTTFTIWKQSPMSTKISVERKKKLDHFNSSHLFYSPKDKKIHNTTTNTNTLLHFKNNHHHNKNKNSQSFSHENIIENSSSSSSKLNIPECRKQWNDLFSSPTKRRKRDNNNTVKHIGVDTTTPSLSSSEEQEHIPGLYLYENFITQEEEKLILSALDTETNNPWKQSRFNGKNLGKRWGVHCNLRDRRVDVPQIPLPSFITDILIPKLNTISIMEGCIPNEANAIDYYKNYGHYLKHHVDDRFLSKEPIANLSLAGSCYMTFIYDKKNKNNNTLSLPLKKKVLLRPKTLLILTGKSRYDYSHGIYHEDLLSTRRVSVTMRESPLSIQSNTTITKHFNQS